MREIMFRIWNKTTHSMHYEKDLKEIKNSIVKEFATNMYFKLIPNHKNNRIMQFTGLKDKNDIEIYEGDIVKIKFMTMFEDKDFTGVVKFYDGGFFVENEKLQTAHFLFREIDLLEVIGNIYENLDLMEG